MVWLQLRTRTKSKCFEWILSYSDFYRLTISELKFLQLETLCLLNSDDWKLLRSSSKNVYSTCSDRGAPTALLLVSFLWLIELRHDSHHVSHKFPMKIEDNWNSFLSNSWNRWRLYQRYYSQGLDGPRPWPLFGNSLKITSRPFKGIMNLSRRSSN